jgi:hypothetical protein
MRIFSPLQCAASGRMTFLGLRSGCRKESSSSWRFGKDGLKGRVFKEADLDADGDDLPEFDGRREVLAAGTEVGKAEVADTG